MLKVDFSTRIQMGAFHMLLSQQYDGKWVFVRQGTHDTYETRQSY